MSPKKKGEMDPEDEVDYISVGGYFRDKMMNARSEARNFIVSLIPFISWITRYELRWLGRDIVCGITVGIIFIPQSMSYAHIAMLPPQFGLYSAFICSILYTFLSTSKEVCVGPVSNVALLTADIILQIQAEYPGVWSAPTIATALTLLCGLFIIAISMLRLGWLVECISISAINAFINGSAIIISVRQLPTLLGIHDIGKNPVDLQAYETFKNIERLHLYDAVWGLTGLTSLYVIRSMCRRLTASYPKYKSQLFFIEVMRSVIVMTCLSIAAAIFCWNKEKTDEKCPLNLLRTIPAGLQHVQTPYVDRKLYRALAKKISVAVIFLFVQHMAATKSLASINGYKTNPDQELIAIGIINIVASFFGAYPAAGSFSVSTLKSKLGVRTPLSCLVIASVIVIALYALTDVFYWIPVPAMSAVILDAVLTLYPSLSDIIELWSISPPDFFVWISSLSITIISSVEIGTYTAIGLSLFFFLYRIAHQKAEFLGKTVLYDIEGKAREAFMPLVKNSIDKSRHQVIPVSLDVLIYRFGPSIISLNCTVLSSDIINYVMKNFRQGKEQSEITLWNYTCKDTITQNPPDEKPDLRAIVFDISATNHLDVTGAISLVYTRLEVNQWVGHSVAFHFAGIGSGWVYRALVVSRFGVYTEKPYFILPRLLVFLILPQIIKDESEIEVSVDEEDYGTREGLSRTPFFHDDLHLAVKAATHQKMETFSDSFSCPEQSALTRSLSTVSGFLTSSMKAVLDF